MTLSLSVSFADPDLCLALCNASDAEIDTLDFGVIGIDAESTVRRYNKFESDCAGLSQDRVVGHPLFTIVAPCMNNFFVAQRFEDAAADDRRLDVTIDYVLALRMRPVKVKLRLLAEPGAAWRYVLVQRRL